MRSIRTKITITYLILAGLVIGLLGVILSYEFERFMHNRLVNELTTDTSVLKAYLKEVAFPPHTRSEVEATLGTIAATKEMRITLIDQKGTVLFDTSVPDSLLGGVENHYRRPEIGRARRDGVGFDSRMSETVSLEMEYVARMVDEREFHSSLFPDLQYVRASMRAERINTLIEANRWKILITALIVFAVVILVSRAVARRITEPVREIESMVKEMKQGDLSRRLPIKTDDELGRLSTHINQMADKLQQDIDDFRRLERYRSEFLGNVSHELRTPIFSLQGFLETLLEGAIDDPQVNRTFVEKANHHASRLNALLSDLMEISRIESGDMKMSYRFFDVSSFLRQIAAESQDELGKKRQTIQLRLPEGEVMVYGDKERLSQAIGNMIDNAIKYTQEGSTITLTAEPNDDHVMVSISDNGPGIASEHLPRIFERFYRVDKNRSREVGGTGLGLAIAKHIIEAHGSKITVQSTVGSGTTFSFQLRG